MAFFGAKIEEIEVVANDSPIIPVKITDDAGVDIDVTGWSFKMTVDPDSAPSDNTTKLFDVNAVLVAPVTGDITFQPTAINLALAPDTYFYDIEMTTTAPMTRTILKGQFIVGPDITKAP
jgi:hypothetical protein